MATSKKQAQLDDYTAGTGEETVTQTVVAQLETSQRKSDRIQQAVDEFQKMCQYLGDMMPSIPLHDRRRQNPTLYRLITREFPSDDRVVSSKVALAATNHVVAAYDSWHERGQPGDRPTFGDGVFFQIDSQQLRLVKNERGFGLKVNFIPYNPEWFHINPRPYTDKYLSRVCTGDATLGTAEFRITNGGKVFAHLPVSWDVEVYDPAELSTAVGVDIGERVLYAAAVVTNSDIESVSVESGREFRHYRERLKEKRSDLQEKGDLRAVRDCLGEQERYTEQVLDTASREIVDLAVDYSPAVIHLEDLTDYRVTAKNPIHDWPYALLQEKIAYKATAEGIPTQTVNARNTSQTCRKCGQINPEYRDGAEFHCTRCGYKVHADVNAAINISQQ